MMRPRASTGLRVKALVALLLAGGATAAAGQDRFASPRWGSFELAVSSYRPKIDSAFGPGFAPFATAFGNGRSPMFRADGAYSLFVNYGTLDVGIGVGFYQVTGHGINSVDNTVSSDLTKFRVLPTRLTLTYRFDMFVDRYPIPLVPYVRASLDRYWWWVLNGSGDTASAGGRSGSGATNGVSFSAGLQFLLDFIDRTLARDMDRNTGINHTYLFVEGTKSYVNDFGSATSWDLSNDRVTLSGGILFVF